MHLRLAYGGVLALSHGMPSDTTPRVYVASPANPMQRRSAHVMLLLVEPVEAAPGVDEIAEQVISIVVDALHDAPAGAAAGRLCEAVDQANELVRSANQRRSGARRVLLGLTCVVAAGADLLVAHLPPGQLIVRQPGGLTAYPRVEAWPAATPQIDAPYARPLGLHRETSPALLVSALSSGDIVCAMTTTVAAPLALGGSRLSHISDGDDLLTLIGDSCDRAGLQDGAVGILQIGAGRLGARRQQGAIAIPPAAEPISRTGTVPLLDRRDWAVQTGTAHDGPDSSALESPGYPGAEVAMPVPETGDHTDELPVLGPRFASHSRPERWGNERSTRADGEGRRSIPRVGLRPIAPPAGRATLFALQASALAARRDVITELSQPRSFAMLNILAGLLLSLVATVVGVWTVNARRDRPLHGPRDDGTFPIPTLQRWDVSYRPPRFQRLRSSMPHLEAGRIIVVGLLAIVLLAGGMYGFSQIRAHSGASAEQFEEQFQLVLNRHQDALTEPDLPTAYAILIEARTRLEDLASSLDSGATDSRLEQERVALDAEIDRLANITRYSSVNVIGTVPSAPENVKPRLIAGGGRIFLLSDALYQLDPAHQSLVRLIGAGDTLGDAKVGTLRGAAWRGDRPIVVDETSVWNLDPATGTWSREPLGTFDATGYVAVGAIEAFEQNLYMLTTDSGQILKFQAGSYASSPDDWADGVPTPEIAAATDLAVDGRIWALMKNGRVLDMFRSRIENDLQPHYVPPLDSAVALSASQNSQYLYILNASDGRIVRLSRDGSIVQQFMAAPGSPSMDKASDFVIDEGTGVAFILAGDTIYSVRVPSPPS